MAAVTLALNAMTATTVTFDVGALAADGTLELQLAARADFQFCVCPIYVQIARATPIVVQGINQDAKYYARMRSRRVSGAAEDWSNVVAFKTPVNVARDFTVPALVVDNAIIMKPEPIISWTGANTVAGFPEKNVSRDAPVAWRSILGGAGDTNIVLEHSGTPIDTIAIMQTNMPEAGNISVRGAATLAGVPAGTILANGVPFRASANMPGRNGYHALVRLAAPASYRFIGIYLNPGGALPASTVHVEHIAIGLNRKTKNMALDSNESPINLGSKDRTRSGNPDAVLGMKMRRVEFDLAFLTETQSETNYQEVMSWMDETVFVVPNSKAGPFLHDRMLYGDLKGHRRASPTSIHATRTFIVESLI